ncbi:MAG: type II secretion system protein [Patescibacteria group bacterium]
MITWKQSEQSRGFTLIELLLAMAIMGILLSLGSVAFIHSIRRGNDSKRAADLNTIRNALEMYYSEEHSYPDPGTSDWVTVDSTNLDDLTPTYLKTFPADPGGTYSYKYQVRDDGDCYCLSGHMQLDDSGNDAPGDCNHCPYQEDPDVTYNYTITCP